MHVKHHEKCLKRMVFKNTAKNTVGLGLLMEDSRLFCLGWELVFNQIQTNYQLSL